MASSPRYQHHLENTSYERHQGKVSCNDILATVVQRQSNHAISEVSVPAVPNNRLDTCDICDTRTGISSIFINMKLNRHDPIPLSKFHNDNCTLASSMHALHALHYYKITSPSKPTRTIQTRDSPGNLSQSRLRPCVLRPYLTVRYITHKNKQKTTTAHKQKRQVKVEYTAL